MSLAGDLESWDEVLPTLQSNFQVIRYDQRGAGLSEKTSLLTVDIVLDDLRGLLDGLAVGDPVLLAGAALGGGYALAFAARDPERVAQVVATSPATGVTDEAGKGLRESAELAETAGMRAAVESSLALSYPQSLRSDLSRYDRYRARWLTNDPISFGALCRMLADVDLEWIFERIQCDVLILGATQDPIRQPAAVKLLAQRIARSTYREVDSGHFLAVQSPALFLDETLAFLKGS